MDVNAKYWQLYPREGDTRTSLEGRESSLLSPLPDSIRTAEPVASRYPGPCAIQMIGFLLCSTLNPETNSCRIKFNQQQILKYCPCVRLGKLNFIVQGQHVNSNNNNKSDNIINRIQLTEHILSIQ